MPEKRHLHLWRTALSLFAAIGMVVLLEASGVLSYLLRNTTPVSNSFYFDGYSYTLRYEAGEGVQADGMPGEETVTGQDQTNHTFTISGAQPVRTGTDYAFLGWSDSPGATAPDYAPEDPITLTMAPGRIAAQKTLYAVWLQNGYALFYHANGGTGAPPAQYAADLGDSFSFLVSETIPARADRVFMGWADNPASDTPQYSHDGRGGTQTMVPLTASAGRSKTVYAVWGYAYSLSFDINGGVGDMPQNQTLFSVQPSVTLTIPTSPVPHRTLVEESDYYFYCWSEFASGILPAPQPPDNPGGYAPGDGVTLTADAPDKTLYAYFRTDEFYRVYFETNASAAVSGMPAQNPVIANSTEDEYTFTITTADPARADHHLFDGWSTDPGAPRGEYCRPADRGTASYKNEIRLNRNAAYAVRLYAVWIEEPHEDYRLILDANGGTITYYQFQYSGTTTPTAETTAESVYREYSGDGEYTFTYMSCGYGGYISDGLYVNSLSRFTNSFPSASSAGYRYTTRASTYVAVEGGRNRSDFHLLGWSLDPDATEPDEGFLPGFASYSITTETPEDADGYHTVTFYAVWREEVVPEYRYGLALYANGGYVRDGSDLLLSRGSVTTIQKAEEYTFTSVGSASLSNITSPPETSTTYYYTHRPDETVTNADGSTSTYRFVLLGWSLDPDAAEPDEGLLPGFARYTVTKDAPILTWGDGGTYHTVRLYAVWEAHLTENYTLRLNANGGNVHYYLGYSWVSAPAVSTTALSHLGSVLFTQFKYTSNSETLKDLTSHVEYITESAHLGRGVYRARQTVTNADGSTTVTGYSLAGWSRDPDADPEDPTLLPPGFAEYTVTQDDPYVDGAYTAELFAIWRENADYRLLLDANGGTIHCRYYNSNNFISVTTVAGLQARSTANGEGFLSHTFTTMSSVSDSLNNNCLFQLTSTNFSHLENLDPGYNQYPHTYTYRDPVTDENGVVTRYSLVGWSTDPDADPEDPDLLPPGFSSYTVYDTDPVLDGFRTAVLYAIWEENVDYRLLLDANGGNIYYNARYNSYSRPYHSATAAGLQWRKTANGEGQMSHTFTIMSCEAGKSGNGNYLLSSFTRSLTDRTANDSSFQTYTYRDPVTDENGTVTRYALVGWSTDPHADPDNPDPAHPILPPGFASYTVYDTDPVLDGYRTAVLYAIWEENADYRLILDANGGKIRYPQYSGYSFVDTAAGLCGKGLANGEGRQSHTFTTMSCMSSSGNSLSQVTNFLSGSAYTYRNPVTDENGAVLTRYSLVGWSTDPHADPDNPDPAHPILPPGFASYTVYDTDPVLDGYRTAVLYAIWAENAEFRLILNPNGGASGTSATKQIQTRRAAMEGLRAYTFTHNIEDNGMISSYSSPLSNWTRAYSTPYASGARWLPETFTAESGNAYTVTHTLLGWSRDPDAAEPDAGLTPGFASYTVSFDDPVVDGYHTAVLYAVWDTSVRYTLTYNANGGSPAPAAQTARGYAPYADGYDFTVPQDVPVKQSFVFMGWTDVQGSSLARYGYVTEQNRVLAGEGSEPLLATYHMTANAKTLYAVWWREYFLRYDANGGSIAVPDERALTNATAKTWTLTTVLPQYEGHTFLGWATRPNATQAAYAPGEAIIITGESDGSTTTTLYAVWQPDSPPGD